MKGGATCGGQGIQGQQASGGGSQAFPPTAAAAAGEVRQNSPWHELGRGDDLPHVPRPHLHDTSFQRVHREEQRPPGAPGWSRAASRRVGAASAVVVTVARCVIWQDIRKPMLWAVGNRGTKGACTTATEGLRSAPTRQPASPAHPRPFIASKVIPACNRGMQGIRRGSTSALAHRTL